MTFVTTLRFTSGDRHVLDSVVNDIKQTARRKGVELKGPHSKPPEDLRVPQSKCPGRDSKEFRPWRYTIYTRTIHILGHGEFARDTAARDFPDDIYVEADVDRITGGGADT
ncbi:uS10/mL48 family ribosomal protein [Halocatena salina]|uniref:Small ribosomal subunit protein uS10 n=1 Tax=Halocatena salina TaxID=2934340 RepID=A0A8U0A027_9EURY|nr:uS10/mL48 family ribosomal protein [Halocatena salina]UPM42099.1 uS10/mL48 family ribosomal protein [Halocatena salina]